MVVNVAEVNSLALNPLEIWSDFHRRYKDINHLFQQSKPFPDSSRVKKYNLESLFVLFHIWSTGQEVTKETIES